MDERRFELRGLKRLVVILEVILGAFFLALAGGFFVQLAINELVVETDMDRLVRTLIALVLIGGGLFIDGLRRGRYWM